MILILQELFILAVCLSVWAEALLLEVTVGAVVAGDTHALGSRILMDVRSDPFWLYQHAATLVPLASSLN